jgi:hypothetical protein
MVPPPALCYELPKSVKLFLVAEVLRLMMYTGDTKHSTSQLRTPVTSMCVAHPLPSNPLSKVPFFHKDICFICAGLGPIFFG